MRKSLTILMLTLFGISIYAQELKVKSMVMSANDSSAKEFERMDLNDQACALVKVKLASSGAIFEGNIIPPTEFKQGEYWVYMTAGSQELRIKHPDFVPIHVTFADYDIKRGVKSSTTYILTLQMPEENADDGIRYLQLRVTPATCKVTVDEKPQKVDDDGVVNLQLPKGIHKYQVEADGYATKTGEVEMKDKSVTETILLERTTPVQLYNAEGIPYEVFKVGDVSFNMVQVEGGTFKMSSKTAKEEYYKNPVHKVTLSTYYIGETEVTQELWHAVMGGTYQGSKNLPVDKINHDDCEEFVKKLNALTGRQFRLPTEAEWEYAARGGNKSRGYKYSGSNNYEEVAWYKLNSRGSRHEVGQMYANELGLYDMTGNVWEYCSDWHAEYEKTDQVNPKGPATGRDRISRGGGYDTGGYNLEKLTEQLLSTTYRNYGTPGGRYEGYGFRLALSM